MKKVVTLILSVIFASLLFAEIPIVHDISAQSGKNKKISIVWRLPEEPDEEITELRVYRDTKQISTYSQIQSMTPIATLPGNFYAYTDTVDDFSDYYYAVIAVTTKPYDLIMLSFNSTSIGVHLEMVEKKEEFETISEVDEKLYPEGTLREIPLPYIDIIEKENIPPIVNKPIISQDVADSTASLYAGYEETKMKSEILNPYIFEEDLISPDGGDDYLLFNILKTTFIQRKYDEAIPLLIQLIGTNISEDTRYRAYFYLGESYYFTGNYKEAVKIFVKVEHIYTNLVKQWLNSSLDHI